MLVYQISKPFAPIGSDEKLMQKGQFLFRFGREQGLKCGRHSCLFTTLNQKRER